MGRALAGAPHSRSANSELHTALYLSLTSFVAYVAVSCVQAPVMYPSYSSEDRKLLLSIAQTSGYVAGKIPAVPLLPLLPREHVCVTVCLLLAGATGFLGLLPVAGQDNGWQWLLVFLSAMCLSPVFGLLVRYLEGRRLSEPIVAVFSFALVVGGGVARSFAALVVDEDGLAMDVEWMPVFLAGCALVVFVVVTVFMHHAPPPSPHDMLCRQRRQPVGWSRQMRFVRRWFAGLALLVLTYALITAYRAYRDFFQPELWEDLLGEPAQPAMYSASEVVIGFVSLAAAAAVYRIESNRRAFFAIVWLMVAGAALIALSAFLQVLEVLPAIVFMIGVGIGIFVVFNLTNVFLTERLLAASGTPITISFLVFAFDGLGKLGTIGVMLYRLSTNSDMDALEFFLKFSFFVAGACALFLVLIIIYFRKRLPESTSDSDSMVDYADLRDDGDVDVCYGEEG